MDDGRAANAVSPAVDLTTYDAVILDFDGPMCNVFAGYPAATIALELKRLLAEHGWQADALPISTDPHQIVRLVHDQAPALVRTVEAALTAAEIVAVESATETPGLGALLSELKTLHIPVAVASNNNAGAIRRWLDRIGHEIEHVVGRDPLDPSKMKPAPHVLKAALQLLGMDATQVAFVGDSISDAQAATSVGCAFVGLANKPHKRLLFDRCDYKTIVQDLTQLAPTYLLKQQGECP